MSTQQSRARARAARRRHLQQRQTVIFGTLIAAMLVVGLAAGAMWVGILPSPFSVAIRSPEPSTSAATVPCPPDGATFLPLEDITANVLNGTSRAGLAASTSDALSNHGITVDQESNAEAPYSGTVQIVAGAEGLAAAFTIAELFEGAVIETDSRGGATVDVVLGANFEALRAEDEIAIDPDAPIPAATDCTPLSTASPSAEEG
ncbi:LytR C-terminal domain-containing protein [Ruania albidiflava]|uniref:LytR C-terminal domain-containing protein n=1 Tax=Ruania albidiflava TaxID=366586 RepID=UPI0023F29452|nr:LytR C-terminal domain-containing protein [Ruania albidiflava]